MFESILDIEMHAAAKLEARFRNSSLGVSGPTFRGKIFKICKICVIYQLSTLCRLRGIHDCLVPVMPYLAGIFKDLQTKQKLPSKVRAMDMHHVLPFIPEGLLTEEVTAYNRQNPFSRISDSSPNMVQNIIILISQYGVYRRRIPAKDEEDIQDLDTLGHRYI